MVAAQQLLVQGSLPILATAALVSKTELVASQVATRPLDSTVAHRMEERLPQVAIQLQ